MEITKTVTFQRVNEHACIVEAKRMFQKGMISYADVLEIERICLLPNFKDGRFNYATEWIEFTYTTFGQELTVARPE